MFNQMCNFKLRLQLIDPRSGFASPTSDVVQINVCSQRFHLRVRRRIGPRRIGKNIWCTFLLPRRKNNYVIKDHIRNKQHSLHSEPITHSKEHLFLNKSLNYCSILSKNNTYCAFQIFLLFKH